MSKLRTGAFNSGKFKESHRRAGKQNTTTEKREKLGSGFYRNEEGYRGSGRYYQAEFEKFLNYKGIKEDEMIEFALLQEFCALMWQGNVKKNPAKFLDYRREEGGFPETQIIKNQEVVIQNDIFYEAIAHTILLLTPGVSKVPQIDGGYGSSSSPVSQMKNIVAEASKIVVSGAVGTMLGGPVVGTVAALGSMMPMVEAAPAKDEKKSKTSTKKIPDISENQKSQQSRRNDFDSLYKSLTSEDSLNEIGKKSWNEKIKYFDDVLRIAHLAIKEAKKSNNQENKKYWYQRVILVDSYIFKLMQPKMFWQQDRDDIAVYRKIAKIGVETLNIGHVLGRGNPTKHKDLFSTINARLALISDLPDDFGNKKYIDKTIKTLEMATPEMIAALDEKDQKDFRYLSLITHAYSCQVSTGADFQKSFDEILKIDPEFKIIRQINFRGKNEIADLLENDKRERAKIEKLQNEVDLNSDDLDLNTKLFGAKFQYAYQVRKITKTHDLFYDDMFGELISLAEKDLNHPETERVGQKAQLKYNLKLFTTHRIFNLFGAGGSSEKIVQYGEELEKMDNFSLDEIKENGEVFSCFYAITKTRLEVASVLPRDQISTIRHLLHTQNLLRKLYPNKFYDDAYQNLKNGVKDVVLMTNSNLILYYDKLSESDKLKVREEYGESYLQSCFDQIFAIDPNLDGIKKIYGSVNEGAKISEDSIKMLGLLEAEKKKRTPKKDEKKTEKSPEPQIPSKEEKLKELRKEYKLVRDYRDKSNKRDHAYTTNVESGVAHIKTANKLYLELRQMGYQEKEFSDLPELNSGFGKLLHDLEQYENSVNLFQDAINLAPDNGNYINELFAAKYSYIAQDSLKKDRILKYKIGYYDYKIGYCDEIIKLCKQSKENIVTTHNNDEWNKLWNDNLEKIEELKQTFITLKDIDIQLDALESKKKAKSAPVASPKTISAEDQETLIKNLEDKVHRNPNDGESVVELYNAKFSYHITYKKANKVYDAESAIPVYDDLVLLLKTIVNNSRLHPADKDGFEKDLKLLMYERVLNMYNVEKLNKKILEYGDEILELNNLAHDEIKDSNLYTCIIVITYSRLYYVESLTDPIQKIHYLTENIQNLSTKLYPHDFYNSVNQDLRNNIKNLVLLTNSYLIAAYDQLSESDKLEIEKKYGKSHLQLCYDRILGIDPNFEEVQNLSKNFKIEKVPDLLKQEKQRRADKKDKQSQTTSSPESPEPQKELSEEEVLKSLRKAMSDVKFVKEDWSTKSLKPEKIKTDIQRIRSANRSYEKLLKMGFKDEHHEFEELYNLNDFFAQTLKKFGENKLALEFMQVVFDKQSSSYNFKRLYNYKYHNFIKDPDLNNVPENPQDRSKLFDRKIEGLDDLIKFAEGYTNFEAPDNSIYEPGYELEAPSSDKLDWTRRWEMDIFNLKHNRDSLIKGKESLYESNPSLRPKSVQKVEIEEQEEKEMQKEVTVEIPPSLPEFAFVSEENQINQTTNIPSSPNVSIDEVIKKLEEGQNISAYYPFIATVLAACIVVGGVIVVARSKIAEERKQNLEEKKRTEDEKKINANLTLELKQLREEKKLNTEFNLKVAELIKLSAEEKRGRRDSKSDIHNVTSEDLEQFQKTYENLRTEMKKVQEKAKEDKNQREKLADEIDKLQAESKKKNKKIQELEKKHREEKAKNKTDKTEIEKLRSVQQSNTKTIVELENRIELITDKKDKEIEANEKEIAELKTQLNESQRLAEIKEEKSQTKIKDLEKELKAVQEQKDNLKKINQLQQRVKDIRQEKKAAIDELKQQIELVRVEKQSLTESSDNKIRKLEASLRVNERMLGRSQDTVIKMEHQLQEQDHKFKMEREAIDKLKYHMAEEQDLIAKKQKELNELSQKLIREEKSKYENQELQADLLISLKLIDALNYMNFYRQFTDVDFEDLNRGEGFEIMKKVSKEDMELIWSGNDKIDEGGIHDILKKCREEKEKKAEKPKTGEEQAGETQIQMLSRLIQQISHPDFRDRYGIPRITPGKAPATREHAMLMSAFMSEKYNPENTK